MSLSLISSELVFLLNTFGEALEAFRTAVSFRFFQWLKENVEVFSLYKASLGFIWA